MPTRRPTNPGLTAEAGALVLTPAQRAAAELEALELQPEFDDEPQTPADRIAVMLEQYGDAERCKVALYKVTGPNEYEWLSDYAPEQFESAGLEGIRQQFGTGKFQVRLYATMPDSKRFVVRMKENIQIGGALNSSLIPQQSQASAETNGVLRMLAEGQQRLFEALTNKPAADPMAEMTKMLQMMTLMREAMGISNQPPQKSNLTEILDTVRELRSVSEELNPKAAPSADPENPLTMLPQILELVKVGMTQNQQQAPQMQRFQPVTLPPAIASAPIPSAEQPSETSQENEEMNFVLLAKLKTQLAELVEKAAANSSIEESAEKLYETIPDEFIEALFADDWWSLLSTVAPEVIPHQEWFAKVRDTALPLFDQSEDEEEVQHGEPTQLG